MAKRLVKTIDVLMPTCGNLQFLRQERKKMVKSYLEYMLTGHKPKTNVYTLFSKSSGDRLGEIKWYAPWRQYCFFPDDVTIWAKGCLNEVNLLIEKFMEEWRESKVKETEQ